MNAKDAIKQAYELSQMVLNSYVADFTDEELLQRPAGSCNHIAWQLGHLITSECNLLNMVAPGAAPELPVGFADNHNKETCGNNELSDFCTKDQYLELYGQAKAATFAALDAMSEEDLAKEAPEDLRSICPNVGGVFMLISTHPMMHAGQFVPVRRNLNKPIVI